DSVPTRRSSDLPPVFDVHVHAIDGTIPGVAPMCPNTSKFTASDPKTKEEPFGWVKEQCTPELYPSAPGQYMKDVLAEMERLNVTAVVFGDPKSVQRWKDAAPARVIPGTSFSNGLTPGQRAEVPGFDGRSAAARGIAGPPSKTAGTSDACGLSHDR